jgi:uroporphyrin-III C-methyltransferase
MCKEKMNFYPVSIVGAGPGDPDLLTVRAKMKIEEADVLLYDCLPAVHVLEKVSKNTNVIFLNSHDPELTEKTDMTALMIQYYNQGLKVVRLKAGDAMMFNGGGIEARKLKKQGIPFEIVPGISAGTAGASLFAIPITEKYESNGVINIIAYEIRDNYAQIRDVAQMMLKHGTTAILYMAYDNLKDIFRVFQEEGVGADMPVVAASMLSLSDEDCVTGTIANIQQKMEDREMLSPFTFFVGRCVENNIEPKTQDEKVNRKILQMC